MERLAPRRQKDSTQAGDQANREVVPDRQPTMDAQSGGCLALHRVQEQLGHELPEALRVLGRAPLGEKRLAME